MSKKQTTRHQGHLENLKWDHYKEIAQILNETYPNTDIALLKSDELTILVESLDTFKEKSTKPERYMLDDIRFAWFFMQKESTESYKNLRSFF